MRTDRLHLRVAKRNRAHLTNHLTNVTNSNTTPYLQAVNICFVEATFMTWEGSELFSFTVPATRDIQHSLAGYSRT